MKIYSSREDMFASKQQSSTTKSNQQQSSQLPKLETKSSMLGESEKSTRQQQGEQQH